MRNVSRRIYQSITFEYFENQPITDRRNIKPLRRPTKKKYFKETTKSGISSCGVLSGERLIRNMLLNMGYTDAISDQSLNVESELFPLNACWTRRARY